MRDWMAGRLRHFTSDPGVPGLSPTEGIPFLFLFGEENSPLIAHLDNMGDFCYAERKPDD